MAQQVIYETLEVLANKYIPKGTHKMLYVNSRETWMNLMVDLIDAGCLKKNLPMLTKCVMNWEGMLIQKISIQN